MGVIFFLFSGAAGNGAYWSGAQKVASHVLARYFSMFDTNASVIHHGRIAFFLLHPKRGGPTDDGIRVPGHLCSTSVGQPALQSCVSPLRCTIVYKNQNQKLEAIQPPFCPSPHTFRVWWSPCTSLGPLGQRCVG